MTLTEQWSGLCANSEANSVILAFDLGGTKLGYGLFAVTGNAANRSLSDAPLYANAIATPRGKTAIKDTFIAAVSDAIGQCQKIGYRLLPHAAMGSPGRFIGENADIIAPGSCVNLGLFPAEFDGLNISEFLLEALPKSVQLTVKNDAIAQMAAGLYMLQQDPPIAAKLLSQKVCYVGPGTGLGGGFCQIDTKGSAHYFSDGHIYDILIADEDGRPAGAEDLFSGTAFKTRTGKTAFEVNSVPGLLAQYEPEIVLMGEFLAALIQKITMGDIQKKHPDANWPEADKRLASGTRTYVIGGSMGTKGKMGALIQKTALETLEKMGISEVQFFSIPDSQFAGLLGAANFLSRNDLNRAWLSAETIHTA